MADEKIDERIVLGLALLELITQAIGRMQWLFSRPSAKLSAADKAKIDTELSQARARLDKVLASLP